MGSPYRISGNLRVLLATQAEFEFVGQAYAEGLYEGRTSHHDGAPADALGGA